MLKMPGFRRHLGIISWAAVTCDLCVLRLTVLTLKEHSCPQLPFNPWGEQVFPISSYICVQRCVGHLNLTTLEYLHRGKWQIFMFLFWISKSLFGCDISVPLFFLYLILQTFYQLLVSYMCGWAMLFMNIILRHSWRHQDTLFRIIIL